MSAICGVWRSRATTTPHADAELAQSMLERVAYRGDTTEIQQTARLTVGIRSWKLRKDASIRRTTSTAIGVAGNTLGGEDSADLLSRAFAGPSMDSVIDGDFAGAMGDDEADVLRLFRDPFGMRSLYYFVHSSGVYFASELKQLLVVADCPKAIDLTAIHKYLTFSFVPGEAVPILGIRRVLPGHVVEFRGTKEPIVRAYFELSEALDPALLDRRTAVTRVRKTAKAAVGARVEQGEPVGLYLSGGLDSSALAVWLKSLGVNATALTLDFGDHSVEREEAEIVAKSLGLRHVLVPMTGGELNDRMPELASMLDLPFGDAVTGPQLMLGLAARDLGLSHVMNGEGGDQLFGGWTNKPMIAAEIFAGVVEQSEDSREETYLRSYHRFYGLEDALYSNEFRQAVGGPGQRRAHLKPYLSDDRGESFLNRLRLADIALKGSQNILPRAERIAAGLGLSLSMPLFDRALAELSFHLPPEMKLNGACEKYVLKLAMEGRLPDDVIWRKKSGMSVPMTDWLLGPLRGVLEEYAGDAAIRRRGWFQPSYVAALRDGQDQPGETRRRRVGEKLWTLVMLEAWMRHVVEAKAE